jgi:hypothetical protein
MRRKEVGRFTNDGKASGPREKRWPSIYRVGGNRDRAIAYVVSGRRFGANRRCLLQDAATDAVREGEVGCLFDEIQHLVGPTERRTMDSQAGPQRSRMPERRGRVRAPDSPCRARKLLDPSK